MARQLVLGESQVYRWIAELKKRGLLATVQQGPGRIAVRRLLAVPEPVQLSLFDQLEAPVPAPAAAGGAARDAKPAAAPVAPWPRMDATLPSHQREAAVDGQFKQAGGARCARKPAPKAGVLEQHLDEVLEVLDAAPGLFVEPMAVNSALSACPERSGYDHLAAAHVVASYAHEGGLHVSAANRLLLAVLRKQTRAAPKARWHAGRRRPAAPPMSPAMQAQRDRETETMWRLMKAAGFGGPEPTRSASES
jgi:hypothetical protein